MNPVFFWGSYSRSVEEWVGRCSKQSVVKRLWEKDPTLWKKDPADQGEIVSRLGWLDAAARMKPLLPELKLFVDEVLSEGVTDVVLLGMGGSSLAPEVFQSIIGNKPGYPRLTVLDSTDPERLKDVEAGIDLSKTLFIVSSKSGGTVELTSFYKYFFEKIKVIFPEKPGSRFIAITDPGSPLAANAKDSGFRRIFFGFPDVGGRFSALTSFGLVPAALIGADLTEILASAEKMMKRCLPDVNEKENEALELGIGMAVLAESGRDKLTILAPARFEAFGDWVEQLVAESTGKEEAGVIPVVREPAEEVEHYGDDRFFVILYPGYIKDDSCDSLILKLKDAGHPVAVLRPSNPEDLGGEFFRWEMATAIASSLLKINAFDQPDVQFAKDKTRALLDRIGSGEKLSLPEETSLELFWEDLKIGDYAGILAFLPDREPLRTVLKSLQTTIRRATKAAVTLGFGPRYLHSTGQLHKGGPDNGVFLLITAEHSLDLPVPGEKFTFAQLELAQAIGDFEALKGRGRRAVHLRLRDVSAPTVKEAAERVKSALMASLVDEIS